MTKKLKHETSVKKEKFYALQYLTFSNTIKKRTHGILICGSGYGVSIAANRFKDVRAVVCRTPKEAEMARRHNNANVLCLGADFTTTSQAKKIVKTFFTTKFEGGRHQRRVKKLGKL